jgi:hypothetical protein
LFPGNSGLLQKHPSYIPAQRPNHFNRAHHATSSPSAVDDTRVTGCFALFYSLCSYGLDSGPIHVAGWEGALCRAQRTAKGRQPAAGAGRGEDAGQREARWGGRWHEPYLLLVSCFLFTRSIVKRVA